MAYQTGTASSMADLVSQMFTFLTGNGWTQDELNTGAGKAAIHLGKVFVSFRWNTAAPLHLALYHALGFGVGLSSVTISAAGTSYVVGDIVTLAGGTFTTAATIRVTSVGGGGAVTGVVVETAGVNYTVNPSNPASTTGGAGSGLTLTCTFTGTAAGDPGQHCDDSGNGIVSSVNTSLAESRALNDIGNGPYTRYHFFLDTSPDYFHLVLEYSAGLFRHAGFGTLDKLGDFIGGEYCYAHTHLQSSPVATANTCLLDGLFASATGNTEQQGATIRLQQLANQSAAQKWAVCYATTGTPAADRAGNAKVRVLGGFRSGPLARAFGWLRANDANAFLPLTAILAIYWDLVPAPDNLYPLGTLPDVRAVNMAPYTAAQELTIGAETWMVFPTVRKQFTGVTDESRNQGIAYKKVP